MNLTDFSNKFSLSVCRVTKVSLEMGRPSYICGVHCVGWMVWVHLSQRLCLLKLGLHAGELLHGVGFPRSGCRRRVCGL